jgi:PAS domain S-box-containing protein
VDPGILRRLSLKTRVTFFTLAIFVASIWSLAFYASRMLREDMQRVLGEQQFSTALILAAQINQGLADRMRGLERIAGEINPAMMKDPAALRELLERRPLLQIFFNAGSVVFDTESTAIADFPVVAGRAGVSYKQLAVVRAALDEGKSSFGKPILSKTSSRGNPIIGIGTPIRDSRGTVIGALAGVIDLGKPNFLDQIAEGHYGNTGGYILVAAQDRLIVTATDKSRIMQPLSAPGVSPQTDRFIQGIDGYAVYVNPRGEEVLNSSKRVPVAGWNMAVTIPTAEAFAPIREMQRNMLLAAVLLTVLAGGLTWWMLRSQLAPMLEALKALAAMSKANQPPQPLPVTSQDEIGDLIAGFNRLLDHLAHRDAALKESEGRYRTLIELTPLAVLVHRGGKMVFVNSAAVKMLGAGSAQDLVGKPILDLVHPDFRSLVQARVQNFADGGAVTPLSEQKLLKLDGTTIDVEVQGASIVFDGEPAVHAALHDITERKRAEEALIAREERFRNLFEGASDGIMILTPAGKLVAVNASFARMHGYSVEEMLSMNLRDLDTAESQQLAPERMQRLLSGSNLHFEVMHFHKDGHEFPLDVSASLIQSGDEPLIQALHRDMTERKQAEAEIRRINAELELHVEQRTHELQVANRELESFAYSVSHDLRAPLRAIEGFSQLIETEYAAHLDERGKDYFRRIRGGATRMANLIDDLLKLSRISRQKMERESVDLSALVREAADDLSGAEPERRVEWVIAPQVTVNGDRGLLRVVVQNLIGNAWKYSSKRENARIEFGVGEGEGRPACFVRDNGAGFDMAYADKLFGAFQRLHSPGEFPGTGIGLATVKRIIHRHGGEVRAEGKVGEGAIFYFTL